MATKSQPQSIEQLLIELNVIENGDRLLVVGAHHEVRHWGAAADVNSLGRLESYSEIPDEIRADVTVVVDQLEHMNKDAGAHLLSRLRDVHSRRVLLILTDDDWSREELLALGYLQIERPSQDERLFLHDPAQFHEPREWNNPSDWAHPENFKKRRW